METLRLAGDRAVTSVPPMWIVPPETVSSPAMSRSVVDLPQPDGPSKAASCLGRTRKLTPSTAGSDPHALLTERSSTSAKTVSNTSLRGKVFAPDRAAQGQLRPPPNA